MGAVWGVVSGKFVITAAGLLIASRIDQGRLQALVDPHVAISQVSRNFAEQRHLGVSGSTQTTTRHPLTIGIGGEEFDQPSLAISDRMPAVDADMVIGRDLLCAHIFALDIDRHDLSLLGPGDVGRLSRHFVAIPAAVSDDGQFRIVITINGLRTQAGLNLGQTEPLEVSTSFWQSSPPTPGEPAHIAAGPSRLNDIPWPELTSAAADHVTLGVAAFKGRTIVLDVPHGRLWISGAPAGR